MYPFFKASRLAVGVTEPTNQRLPEDCPKRGKGKLRKVDHLPHLGPLNKEPLVS